MQKLVQESPVCIQLDNGLRVVAFHVPEAPAAAVCVHYGVGFRSEPRSGFAHLFEHAMFQSGGRHFDAVYSVGGTANGSTLPDYTEYSQAVPTDAVRTVLELEASRMARLDLDQAQLRNQIAVVREEIRTNVTTRPYGGFPWTVLPCHLYTSWYNGHNGYGDLADIIDTTVEECQAFHAAYYSPGNAVVTVCGGIDPQRAVTAAAQAFDSIPARPVTALELDADTCAGRVSGVHADAVAPRPAFALGWPMPDPSTSPVMYRAMVVLAFYLGGPGLPLRRALDDCGADVSCSAGFFGPWRARHPDTMVVTVTHPASRRGDDLAAVVDKHLRPDLTAFRPEDVAAATARCATDALRPLTDIQSLASALGVSELLWSDPAGVFTLPGRIEATTCDEVAAAGLYLSEAPSALVTTGANR